MDYFGTKYSRYTRENTVQQWDFIPGVALFTFAPVPMFSLEYTHAENLTVGCVCGASLCERMSISCICCTSVHHISVISWLNGKRSCLWTNTGLTGLVPVALTGSFILLFADLSIDLFFSVATCTSIQGSCEYMWYPDDLLGKGAFGWVYVGRHRVSMHRARLLCVALWIGARDSTIMSPVIFCLMTYVDSS